MQTKEELVSEIMALVTQLADAQETEPGSDSVMLMIGGGYHIQNQLFSVIFRMYSLRT